MPVAPTYPGVYVEELPSGVHTITGVSTAVTAFVGYFPQGPMDQAARVQSVADLERTYGPLVAASALFGRGRRLSHPGTDLDTHRPLVRVGRGVHGVAPGAVAEPERDRGADAA